MPAPAPGPRVLTIVGTKGPFPRLVDALAQVARANPGWDVRVQHASDALPAGLTGWALVPREVLVAELAAADAVVCHGGSGALRDALAAGHRPIVVPRRRVRGEHVDDHQLALAAALGARVVVCDELEGDALAAALGAAIAQVVGARLRVVDAAPTTSADTLRAALRAEVAAIAARPPSLRARVLYALFARATRR